MTTVPPNAETFTAASFNAAMSALPTAVSIIATHENGTPVGMIMGTLTMVSADPPLIGILPMRSSGTWRRIARTGRFVASILAADQREVVSRLAGRADTRFTRIEWQESPGGGPAVAGCVACLDAVIEAEHEAGDHLIVVAAVTELRIDDAPSAPLVFFRQAFHRTVPVADLPTIGWH